MLWKQQELLTKEKNIMIEHEIDLSNLKQKYEKQIQEMIENEEICRK